jgi:threonine/homoserine/homoserine lactone efflux protein
MDSAQPGLADLILFLKGIAVGLAIAAPVGPVAVLCIRRTIFYGRRYGIASGMGAVIADLLFGAVATFGLVAIARPLLEHQTPLRFVGGGFLLAMGIATWRKRPPPRDSQPSGHLLRAFLSAFLLTITNPITIFAFTAIFAGFDVVRPGMRHAQSLSLLAGVLLGTVLWWLGLTLFASLFRRRDANEEFGWLYHLSGGLLVFFGLAALGSIFVA